MRQQRAVGADVKPLLDSCSIWPLHAVDENYFASKLPQPQLKVLARRSIHPCKICSLHCHSRKTCILMVQIKIVCYS